MKIHEMTDARGELSPIQLESEGDILYLTLEDERFALPKGAIEAVMRRFGGPLDPTERLMPVADMRLDHRSRLRHVRHLSGYDVIARDYLVYDAFDGPPLCALAVTVAGALAHLARAAAVR